MENREIPPIILIPFIVRVSIVILGFTGKSPILVVMNSKKFKKMSTSVYLSVAVSDTIVLIAEPVLRNILPSQIWLNIDVQNMHILGCWVKLYFTFK